jgi:hypothetical protein
MRVKDLKEYLRNFEDTDMVSISMWDTKGSHIFLPNIPCCNPIKYRTKDDQQNIAVIGSFDFCQAHMINKSQLINL